MSKSIGEITIYACGGAGLNIAAYFDRPGLVIGDGFAKITPYYIDTSRANLRDTHPVERTFTYDDIDGSGSRRAENHLPIADSVPSILIKHKPADISIVLSSASGGSGAVIASTLTNELVSRGNQVIAITIGSTDSRIRIENTIKTIMSYDGISRRVGMPIPLYYVENTTDRKRQDIDGEVTRFITMLAMLYSRQNLEIDTADLKNWVNYTKVTNTPSALVLVETFQGDIELARGTSAISVATLAPEGGDTSPGLDVEYHTSGFLRKEFQEHCILARPSHFVTIDGAVTMLITKLKERLAKFDATKTAASAEAAEILRATARKGGPIINTDATDAGVIL